jgi:hypothetical protein
MATGTPYQVIETLLKAIPKWCVLHVGGQIPPAGARALALVIVTILTRLVR